MIKTTYYNKNCSRYPTYGNTIPKFDAIAKACEEAIKERAEREAKRNEK